MSKHNLSNSHDDSWAVFLPAWSSFYISGIGKQREGEDYFPKERIPAGLNGDIECLNFLNEKEGMFTYKWGLYSAGHANLDPDVDDSSESVIRKRDRNNSFILGDSGGFQILKCQWPGDWKDPNCPKSMKKRKEVLRWMDTYCDYGMCLDIPTQSLTTYHIQDPKTGKSVHGISTFEEAVKATHINNEYFIQNRNGNCKFLNVLQGRSHDQSDAWYDEMKKYCDPKLYPDNHFNGWAFGGQNKIDVHLMLKRFINIIHDGLLEPGKHDLVHCLGTSILEYAIIFTDIQRAIRKYHNPNLKITFDCASPFFAAAKGLAYNYIGQEHRTKWTYAMEKAAESKKYSNDSRPFVQASIDDGWHETFQSSPVTDVLLMKDICYRGEDFRNKHGKPTKTSWDTLTYTLLQAHNVYQHIWAVQEGLRKYESGVYPLMVIDSFDGTTFGEMIDEIFSLNDRDKSLEKLEYYSKFWEQMKAGQGFSGKKTVNSLSQFEALFVTEEIVPEDSDEIPDDFQDSDEVMEEVENDF